MLQRADGQSIYEMSEFQLRQLLLRNDLDKKMELEIVRILQTKSRIRHAEVRDKHKIDEEFGKNNF